MLQEYVLGRVQTARIRRIALLLFVGIFILSGLAMTGSSLIKNAAAEGGYTWTEYTTTGQNLWSDVDVSDDGTKLIGGARFGASGDVIGDGHLYTSHDSGLTWNEHLSLGEQTWIEVSISNDGTRLVAVAQMSNVYVSNDSGDTWDEVIIDGAEKYWSYMASSDDGLHLALLDSGNESHLYTSDDGGETWGDIPLPDANLRQLAFAANGTELIVTSAGEDFNSGYIYRTTDNGATWTTLTNAGARPWTSLNVSEDGEKIIAAAYMGFIYISTDSGVTWTERGTQFWNGRWNIAGISDEGSKMAIVDEVGRVYVSFNSGETWFDQTSLIDNSWGDVQMLPNGSIIANGSYKSGYITRGNFAPEAPGSVPYIAIEEITAKSAVLSWSAPNYTGTSPTILGYKVEYSVDGNSWTTYGTNSLDTQRTITGLTPSTEYYFRVSAQNEVGFGTAEIAIETTSALTPPTKPKDISVTAGKNSASLQWTQGDNIDQPIDGYEIQYRKVGSEQWVTASNTIQPSTTSYIVSNLTANNTYDFRIRSFYTYQAVQSHSQWEAVSVVSHEYELPGEITVNILGTPALAISKDKQSIVGVFDNQLYVSNDGGESWTLDDYDLDGALVTSLAFSDDASKIFMTGTIGEMDTYVVSRDNHQDASWTPLSWPTSAVAITLVSPDDGTTVYIGGVDMETFSAILLKSVDSGQTWSPLSLPQDSAPPFTTTIDENGAMYMVTSDVFGSGEFKSYTSDNDGDSWRQVNIPQEDGNVYFIRHIGQKIGAVIPYGMGNNVTVLTSTDESEWDEYLSLITNVVFNGISGYWLSEDGTFYYTVGEVLYSYNGLPLVATPYGLSVEEGSSSGGNSSPVDSFSGEKKAPSSPTSSTDFSLKSSDKNIENGSVISNSPTFSGYAHPYDHIVVTVHSDPVTCETDADASGYWECTLSEALPAGEHTVLVRVTSAADGSVSEYGPYAVTVADGATDAPVVTSETPEDTTATQDSVQDTFWWWIAGGVAALIVIAIIVAAVRRSRQSAA